MGQLLAYFFVIDMECLLNDPLLNDTERLA